MIKFRLKNFSLQEGGYTGKKSSAIKTYLSQSGILSATGVVVGGSLSRMNKGFNGALIGGAVGAVMGLITAALTRSEFNKTSRQDITTKNLFSSFVTKVNDLNNIDDNRKLLVQEYDIDSKKPNKFDVQVKSNNDSIVLYVSSLSSDKVDLLGKILDYYCYIRKNNDYKAKKVGNDWIITVKLINYTEAADLLLKIMIDCSFRINFLTR